MHSMRFKRKIRVVKRPTRHMLLFTIAEKNSNPENQATPVLLHHLTSSSNWSKRKKTRMNMMTPVLVNCNKRATMRSLHFKMRLTTSKIFKFTTKKTMNKQMQMCISKRSSSKTN